MAGVCRAAFGGWYRLSGCGVQARLGQHIQPLTLRQFAALATLAVALVTRGRGSGGTSNRARRRLRSSVGGRGGVTPFVDTIIRLGCGLGPESIVYTSFSLECHDADGSWMRGWDADPRYGKVISNPKFLRGEVVGPLTAVSRGASNGELAAWTPECKQCHRWPHSDG